MRAHGLVPYKEPGTLLFSARELYTEPGSVLEQRLLRILKERFGISGKGSYSCV